MKLTNLEQETFALASAALPHVAEGPVHAAGQNAQTMNPTDGVSRPLLPPLYHRRREQRRQRWLWLMLG